MPGDRNLLFGILALQNHFISRDQLVEAMNRWVLARQKPLGEFLKERGLGQEEHDLLEALVDRHVARHRGDVEKSIQALDLSSSVRSSLQGVTADGVESSLVGLHTTPAETTSEPIVNPVANVLRYRVLRPHARGGLGEVFVAEDIELHREVALKEIQSQHADNPGSRGRFLLEAEITGRLEHPGIVPVYGLGHYADGRPYYAMRFIKGDNLKHAIDRFHKGKVGFDSVEFRQVLRRFLDVCNAVAYAHARGVLHRDLKPGNIMLGEFGETLLVDWGLAKILGRSDSEFGEATLLPSSGSKVVETVAGAAVGTPAYMSPEQAEGNLDALGPATDVYSLGATLYCLLTGQAPVSDGVMPEILDKVRRGDIPAANKVRPGVPLALAAVCVKAMALRPEARYPSALALARELENWLADEPVTVHRESLLTRARRWTRKHRTLVTTVTVGLLVALVGLTLGLVIVGLLNQKLESVNATLTTALEQAEKERTKTLAVNEFLLTDLLDQADISNQPFQGEAYERNSNISVAKLLERAAQRIEGKFPKQPETEGAIRLTIGDACRAVGKYELALTNLKRSVSLREEHLGADHPDTLTSKHSLARLYRARGDWAQAEQLLLEIVRGRELMLGGDHPDTLSSKHNLAFLYRKQRKYPEAERLHLEVLRKREQILEPKHPHILASKQSLGELYADLRNVEKAESYLVEAALQREKILGADHPDTLISNNHLANLWALQRKYDKALSLFVQTQKLAEEKLGLDHPSNLALRVNLAMLYTEIRRYDLAEPLFLQSLQQFEERLGGDHPDTLTTKSNLAQLYIGQEKFNKAETLLVTVAQHLEKKYGADHPEVLSSKNALAFTYKNQRKFDKAESLYVELIQLNEKKRGANHQITLIVKNELALLFLAQRRNEEAEPLLKDVLQQLVKNLGANDQTTVATKNNLAAVYKNLGKYDKAGPLYLEVFQQNEKQRGADDPITLITKNNLGMLYLAQQEYGKAEPLLVATARQREKKLGPLHSHTLQSKNNLGSLYLASGQLEKAESLFLEALRGREKKFGADNPDTLETRSHLGMLYLLQKKYDKAEVVFRELLSICQKKTPTTWLTFNTQSQLGGALLAQKKYGEAEPLLIEGYENLVKQAKSIPLQFRSVRLKEALERLVQLYEATDKPQEAARWRKQQIEQEKKKPLTK